MLKSKIINENYMKILVNQFCFGEQDKTIIFLIFQLSKTFQLEC